MPGQIKCGACKGHHDTVEEVKTCSATFNLGWNGPPTDAQMNYLYVLVEKHPEAGLFPNDCTTKKQASEMIEKLKALGIPKVAPYVPTKPAYVPPRPTYTPPSRGFTPSLPTDTPDTTGVPKGRYAIDIDGTVKFYRWDKGRGHRSKHHYYLDNQQSERFVGVGYDKATRNAIFGAIIMQGVNESRIRYGKLLGKCGCCGKLLTNEVSRAYGIGPECRGRYGI